MPREREPRTALGREVRRLRKAKGLVQDDIVQLSDGRLSQADMSQVETGARPRISWEKVKALGDVLAPSPGDADELARYFWDLRERDHDALRPDWVPGQPWPPVAPGGNGTSPGSGVEAWPLGDVLRRRADLAEQLRRIQDAKTAETAPLIERMTELAIEHGIHAAQAVIEEYRSPGHNLRGY